VRLRIVHTTTFRYDEPVSEASMEMRLRPLDAGGQRCESFRLTTDPPGEVRSYVDRFGNGIRHFDTLNPHDRLVVSARSDGSRDGGARHACIERSRRVRGELYVDGARARRRR